MGPHITIFGPFISFDDLSPEILMRLERLCETQPVMSYYMQELGRFENHDDDIGVVYLRPEPDEPFLTLFRRIKQAFPEAVRTGSDPTIHLTLAQNCEIGDLPAISESFLIEYVPMLPIRSVARSLQIWEFTEGQWYERHRFEFGEQ